MGPPLVTSHRFARAAAVITAALGFSALLGWIFDLPSLRSAAAISTDMNPASAAIFVLGGLSLWALTAPERAGGLNRVARVGAIAIVLLASLRLGELIFGWPIPVDRMLVPGGFAGVPNESPLRVSAGLAVLYILIGAGLLFAALPGVTARTAGRAISLFMTALAGLASLGLIAKLGTGVETAKAVPAPLTTTIVALLLVSLGTAIATANRTGVETGNEGMKAVQGRVNLTIRIAVAILIFTSGLSLWSAVRSQEAARHRHDALVWRSQLAELLTTVQEAETSQRGFLLTNDSTFVNQFQVARDTVSARLKRLASLIGERREQADLVIRLDTLVTAKLAELNLTVDLRKAGLADSALVVVRSGTGEKMMNGIRLLTEKINTERDLLVSRWDARLAQDNRVSTTTSIVGGILAILFLTLAGVAINRDLVNRANTESALRSSEARLAQIIDLIPHMIFLKDPETFRYTRFNRAGTELLGFTEAELVGKGASDLFPEEARRALSTDRSVLATREVLDVPAETVHTKNGDVRVLHTKRVAVRDDEGRPLAILGISEDITERLASETAIRDAKEAAERANHAKSDFLAKMSHELRTPLNSIIGFSEILDDESAGPLTSKQRRYVGNVLVSGRSLLQLINDILDLSKVEAGHMELVKTTFDIKTALEQVRSNVEALAVKKDLSIQVEVAPDLPPLTADRGKFDQIMLNLVGNGLKFTQPGGAVSIRAGLLRESAQPTQVEWLEIAVSDTGIGISNEDLSRIFDEFEQVVAAGQNSQEGTGLGLALTRRLVELHGGRVSVESQLGQGSTFRFTLPLRIAGGESGRAVVSANGDAIAAEQPLVLVIDDEPQARDLLTHYLLESGYRVATTAKGAEAVALAQLLRPHAITLDILMPDTDGLNTLTQLKQAPGTKDIPVLIVSVTDRSELGLTLGAADWLVKPVQASTLIAALERTIGSSSQSSKTVLVVDDEPATIEYLSETLAQQGFAVLTAATGWAGIEMAVAQRPHLILLDLMLPDLNGFDVVRTLRAHPDAGRIPILIVTAKDLSSKEKASLRRTVQGIVPKGGREELLAELRRIRPLVAEGLPT